MLRAITVLTQNGRSWLMSPVAHYILGRLGSVVIASYPRSGSTWLRTMLTHLIIEGYDSNPVEFNRLIPGVTISRIPQIIVNRPQICSTHALFNAKIKKAVYIIRDPRRSIPSLYRYTTSRVGLQIRAPEWAKLYCNGFYGPRWDQHVFSWLGNGRERLSDTFLLLRYEDMCMQTHESLLMVAKFLGFPHLHKRLVRAIDMSKPAVMREWERRDGIDISDPNSSFYRGGEVDEWQELFPSEIQNMLLDQMRRAMSLANYA